MPVVSQREMEGRARPTKQNLKVLNWLGENTYRHRGCVITDGLHTGYCTTFNPFLMEHYGFSPCVRSDLKGINERLYLIHHIGV